MNAEIPLIWVMFILILLTQLTTALITFCRFVFLVSFIAKVFAFIIISFPLIQVALSAILWIDGDISNGYFQLIIGIQLILTGATFAILFADKKEN